MIEALGLGVAALSAMERKIVASAAQVGVVRIGLPNELHPEYARIKLLRALDVGDADGKMAQSSIGNHNDKRLTATRTAFLAVMRSDASLHLYSGWPRLSIRAIRRRRTIRSPDLPSSRLCDSEENSPRSNT